jgi:hypothetical protein
MEISFISVLAAGLGLFIIFTCARRMPLLKRIGASSSSSSNTGMEIQEGTVSEKEPLLYKSQLTVTSRDHPGTKLPTRKLWRPASARLAKNGNQHAAPRKDPKHPI